MKSEPEIEEVGALEPLTSRQVALLRAIHDGFGPWLSRDEAGILQIEWFGGDVPVRGFTATEAGATASELKAFVNRRLMDFWLAPDRISYREMLHFRLTVQGIQFLGQYPDEEKVESYGEGAKESEDSRPQESRHETRRRIGAIAYRALKNKAA